MMARASRFLTAYGADTQHMWSAFGEHLLAKKALDRDAVVDAALKTFDAATAWFGHAFAREDGANAELEVRPRERSRPAALVLPLWVIQGALGRWAPRWKYSK
jgi:hypothetical protein